MNKLMVEDTLVTSESKKVLSKITIIKFFFNNNIITFLSINIKKMDNKKIMLETMLEYKTIMEEDNYDGLKYEELLKIIIRKKEEQFLKMIENASIKSATCLRCGAEKGKMYRPIKYFWCNVPGKERAEHKYTRNIKDIQKILINNLKK
jgi:hypothetical protein